MTLMIEIRKGTHDDDHNHVHIIYTYMYIGRRKEDKEERRKGEGIGWEEKNIKKKDICLSFMYFSI